MCRRSSGHAILCSQGKWGRGGQPRSVLLGPLFPVRLRGARGCVEPSITLGRGCWRNVPGFGSKIYITFFVATPTKIPPCPTVPPSPPGARALLPITRARGTASIETGGEGGALWNPPDADRTGTPPSPACGLWCDGLRGGVACPPRASRRCLAPRSGWLMGRACGVHGAPASPAPPPHPHTLPRSARRGRPRCRPPRRALAPARPARSSCAPGCAW